MATQAQALAAYNTLHGTSYASTADLATDLVSWALRTAWVQLKGQQAAAAAELEGVS